jgi:hypothetical protein
MNKNIKHKSNGDFEVEMETCIMCNQKTNTPMHLDINYREDYIEGAGQLCSKCSSKLWSKNLEKYEFSS